ncbi:hypothetical protein ABZX12_38560 [Kribbella sp. NPDC003505]|uniref:hypothetical protein n=1 Tax=Kribbella sp. NPDC003505 TaxID=3154448 RepID=UPI0033BB83D4
MTALDERRAARTALRDQMANGDVAPATGPQSSVSQEALTRISRQVAAMSGNGPSGLSPDLAKSVQAATLPRVAPGQTRTADPGARAESSTFERGAKPDRNGPAR